MEEDNDGIESRIKTSVLEIYEDLLRTVWAKIVPTLGTVTVVTIVQRAIDSRPLHPIMVFGVRFQTQQERVVAGVRTPVHILIHSDLAVIGASAIDDGTGQRDARNLAEKLLVMKHLWYTVANTDRE